MFLRGSKRKSLQPSLAKYFSIPEQPYRAASLELDYADSGVISRYIPTAKSVAIIDTVCAAVEDSSRDRAISLIAPYGSGKTSLLLFLSSLLEGSAKTKAMLLPLLHRIKRLSPSTFRHVEKLRTKSKGFVIVTLSGYQGDLPALWLRGLKEALARRNLLRIWSKHKPPRNPSHSDVLEIYRAVSKDVTKSGYQGIVLIYDEFGKVLESQQGEARPADLFFLQSFAELCSRSGPQRLVLIVALHQSFAQYAHRLPGHIRSEWAKIEGRFRVIHYVEDSLQVYELIAQTLRQLHGKQLGSIKHEVDKLAEHYAKTSKNVPCFSPLKDKDDRRHIFRDTFPFHPLALYVLPRLSARVAQNERSMFHFLLGNDKNCLTQILHVKLFIRNSPELVTVADLYEYFSHLMLADTGIGGTYRRLIEIKAALDRIKPEDELAVRIIKSIGLLSILGDRLQTPVSLGMLSFALDAHSAEESSALRHALSSLVDRKILLHRRHTAEYRIWEGADVDLVSILRQKKAEVENLINIGAVVSEKVKPPTVFPHRHNEDFCITRVFEGQYVTTRELEGLVRVYEGESCLPNVDGKILYVLADTFVDIKEASNWARKIQHRQVMTAIPAKPLHLSDLVTELYCIELLLQDSGLTSEDPVIRRELSELGDDCVVTLRRVLSKFLNAPAGEVSWWHKGRAQDLIRNRVGLRRYLSQSCSVLYAKTPRFNNEIINRRKPSATVVNARKKVLRALLDHYGTKDFKLIGYGPDVSMFRAIYLTSGLYREFQPGNWRFALPEEIEDQNLRQVIAEIHEFFLGTQGAPRCMQDLIEKLTRFPYGLREGVLPLVIAAGAKSFLLPLNIMEQGVYAKELKAETFDGMVLAPDRYTVQCVPLPDHVLKFMRGIQKVFTMDGAEILKSNDLLRDTVATVYRWIHQLSPCSLASEQVSPEARQLRVCLLKATDPVHLLFVDIPRIVLNTEEKKGDQPWLSASEYKQVLEGLTGLYREINSVLTSYLTQVARITRRTFKLSADGGINGLRDELRKWVSSCESDLREYVDDPQCSGMLERIRSEYETDMKLVESLASLVTGKSLAHWDDTYLKQYELGLLSLYGRLISTNALLAKRLGDGQTVGARESIQDPVLWEHLDQLKNTDKELLAFHLLNIVRKG